MSVKKDIKIVVDDKGYPFIRYTLNGKRVKTPLHVLVWEYINGKKPLGYDIHHKDNNKTNFNPHNLELLSKGDHAKTHAGWVRDRLGAWVQKPCSGCKKILPLESFYSQCIVSAQCKKCTKAKDIKYRLENLEKCLIQERLSYHKNKKLKSC